MDKKSLFSGAIVLLFGFFFLKNCVFNDPKPKTKQELLEDADGWAYIQAQDYVKRRLKYPEEADFKTTPEISQHDDSAVYKESGYVITKNGFGVKSKLYFDCRIKYLGGEPIEPKNWELVSIDIE